ADATSLNGARNCEMMHTGKPATSAIDGAAADYPWLSSYGRDVDWHERFEALPVFAFLDQAAANHPTAVCTDFMGRTTTYANLHRRYKIVAAHLQRLGVTKGSKVGLLLPNSPTFIIYYYAVLRAGGTVVNYNPLYTVQELAFQVTDSDTEIMVTLDLTVLFDKVEALLKDGILKQAIVGSFAAQLPATKSALFRIFKAKEIARPLASKVAKQIIADNAFDDGGHLDPVTIDPHKDIAVIQYTGGTTGTPKGAVLTHANVSINAMQTAAWAPQLEDGKERILAVLPFFHVFAMTVAMNLSIAKAARMIIMPRFVLDDALRLLHTEKPTVMPGVPTLFNALVNHPKIASHDLSSLRFCISGGAPLPLEVKAQFERETGCSVVEGYGLSEAAPVVSCNPVDGSNKAGSIGLPFPQTVISLRDLDDPSTEVPLGSRGEICVKGPQVMQGYWQRPEATKDVFVDGFLRTGDVARMDDDGLFYIEDRIKDLIITSGFNVYPRQIEEAIYTDPAVEEVTVIGIPDDRRGEVAKAFVRLKKDSTRTAEELFEHLANKLSKHELPAQIEFRDELPKTMIGKLSKKELKAEEAAKRQATTTP
ncbi:MAG: long-chain fatty acid--CoA ligase, partial [Pseudomonadota bacterium]